MPSRRFIDNDHGKGIPDFRRRDGDQIAVRPQFPGSFNRIQPRRPGQVRHRFVTAARAVGREMAGLICGEDPALPLTDPELIPVHALTRHIARATLIRSRWRDGQPPIL